MFQNQSLMFVFIAIFAIGLIVYYYQRLPSDAWFVRAGLGMQLGGAIGNLIDRLHQGYVTDFVEFPNFPVFNVADSSISIGVAVLAIYLLFFNKEEQAKTKQSTASETSSAGETATG
jgi:signal peptidase II